MTRRLLPVSDWYRLAETPQLGPIWQHLPANARVVVVEDDGAIVATWALLPVVHVEGLWIAPSHAAAGVPLLRGMRQEARAMGAERVWTGADSDAIRGLLERFHAQPVPYDSFVMPLTRGES